MFPVICCLPASLLYTVIIAPLQQITLPCYEYQESQRGTARGIGTSVGKTVRRMIPHTVDKLLCGAFFPMIGY